MGGWDVEPCLEGHTRRALLYTTETALMTDSSLEE